MHVIRKSVSISTLIMFVFSFTSKVKRCVNQSRLQHLFSSSRSSDGPILTSIESTVAQYLTTNCKVKEKSFVLLSVSGGLDSMAMLHILASISRLQLPLDLEVISFNHKLRPESDEEVRKCSTMLLTSQ